jgi:hypothetical protein
LLGIGDPAESTDTLHVLRLFSQVRSLGAQLREHRIQVADPEVDHRLLSAGPFMALDEDGRIAEMSEYIDPGQLLAQLRPGTPSE